MISTIIITYNEQANIERCLKSVSWTDEIIVVDAESTDATREFAIKNGANVLTKKWEGYSVQKEFALQAATNIWILSLDADEEVSLELKEEIQKIITTNSAFNGFEIPRKSYFLGKWIRYCGWYPGYQLRLFRREKVHVNHRPVHEGFAVSGTVGKTQANINHYTYNSLHQYIDKMNEYSSLDVVSKLQNQKRIHWYNFILNPLSAFLRMFFSLKGFKDGIHGFLLSIYSALHVLVIYAKTWEYQFAASKNRELPPVTSDEIVKLKKLST